MDDSGQIGNNKLQSLLGENWEKKMGALLTAFVKEQISHCCDKDVIPLVNV